MTRTCALTDAGWLRKFLSKELSCSLGLPCTSLQCTPTRAIAEKLQGKGAGAKSTSVLSV